MNAKWVHRAVLLAVLGMTFPVASMAGFFDVAVTVGFAPPALPVYVQPPCPAPGYLWTPGYWAYSDDDGDYYWVPGTWVTAPSPGFLWTPGFWAAVDDEYVWHPGYWAPHVGFYGGINYGFGYFGIGYAGGYWRNRDFFYNRAVTNITNVNITNVYNRTVINNTIVRSRASFNGGNGAHAVPNRGELIAEHEPHRGFTPLQRLQAESAREVPSLLASVNHGHPEIGATARPGDLHGHAAAATSRRGTTPLAGAGARVSAAPRFAANPHVVAASRSTFAPGHGVPARSEAPAPVALHPASRAPTAARWSHAPTAQPHAQAAQWSRAPSARRLPSEYRLAAPTAPVPRPTPGGRFNAGNAAGPRPEAPRPQMQLPRSSPPPRTTGPAPGHDRR